MSDLQGISSNNLSITQPLGPPNATLGKERRQTAEMAKNFESLFLSMMLKGMRQTLESDSLFPGDNGDVMGGLFDQFMGQHLADAGGVGLAASIQRQLQRESSPHVEQPG